MKLLDLSGLGYFISKIKGLLVKVTDWENSANNTWQSWHEGHDLIVGTTMPANCMLKFIFQQKTVLSEGFYTYVNIDEVTVPTEMIRALPADPSQYIYRRIYTSSNGFYSIYGFLEFDDNMTITARYLQGIDGGNATSNLRVVLYYRQMNPKV